VSLEIPNFSAANAQRPGESRLSLEHRLANKRISLVLSAELSVFLRAVIIAKENLKVCTMRNFLVCFVFHGQKFEMCTRGANLGM
jgi:hypothetical protein